MKKSTSRRVGQAVRRAVPPSSADHPRKLSAKGRKAIEHAASVIRKDAEEPDETPPTPVAAPTTLAEYAAQIPAELLENLAKAIKSGKWLVVCYHVEGNQLNIWRTAADFPDNDHPEAIRLFTGTLQELLKHSQPSLPQ